MKNILWLCLAVVSISQLNATVEPIDPLRKIPTGKWSGTGSVFPFNAAAFDFNSGLEIREDGTFIESFNVLGKDPEAGLTKHGRITVDDHGRAKIKFTDKNKTLYEGTGYCLDRACHFDIRYFVDFDFLKPKKQIGISYREFTLQFTDGGVTLIGSDSIGGQRIAHFVKKLR